MQEKKKLNEPSINVNQSIWIDLNESYDIIIKPMICYT